MSIRFQADSDLDFAIVKGVRRQEPALDFASAADSNLRGIKDPALLELASGANRVLVSHDRGTMLDYFRNRLAAGMSSPGLLIVPQDAPIGPVAEAIILLWAISEPIDLRDQAFHLPSLIRHVYPR